MRIGERGQVTIPLSVRTQLGFLPHIEVAFVMKGNGVLLTRAKDNTEQALKQMYGKKKFGRSTGELMRFLRNKPK